MCEEPSDCYNHKIYEGGMKTLCRGKIVKYNLIIFFSHVEMRNLDSMWKCFSKANVFIATDISSVSNVPDYPIINSELVPSYQ